ncbi:GGDEF domain-containing protein [Mesorhizobium sp. CAU 1732]|uniref:GGDEF domain-containing protein n=1 Tax=Mesorhizobium sp. CAU 1732 TaxID=3140358 RepID=UPI0032603C50
MSRDLFIALINPGMALILSAAFFLLWLHQRNRRYILALGFAYVAFGGGFLFQYFLPFGLPISKLISNVLVIGGGISLTLGALSRYGRTVPLKPLIAIACAGLTAYGWFEIVQPSLTWRVYAINFTFGAISLVLAAELHHVARRRMVDNVLLWTACIWGLSLFLRPIVVLSIDPLSENHVNLYESLYWITLIFLAAIFLLIFALILISAVALDVMDDLKRESNTDVLSGLLNRRGFEEDADMLLRSARRMGMPVALIVCDLDRFKAINDTYGHACGDSVIATFAQCLSTCIGTRHAAGRIGGEEFAVLLPGANLGTGRLFAEGVRTSFSTLAIPGLPESTRFTASFGVAEWVEGEGVTELVARADLALYDAKKAGRDCVRVASAPSVTPRRKKRFLADITGGI